MSSVSRIALVGLPGSGKTTVAPLLAARLGWAVVDLDDEIRATSGRSPAEILEGDGEAAFRELEFAALDAVTNRPGPMVIACGGGLIGVPAARALLLDRCVVVWLDAPDVVLIDRLGAASDRPLLEGSATTGIPLLRGRRERAHQTAHLHVDADERPETVASRIANALQSTVAVTVPDGHYHVEVRPGALDDVVLHVPSGAKRVAVVADRAVPKPDRPARRLAAQRRDLHNAAAHPRRRVRQDLGRSGSSPRPPRQRRSRAQRLRRSRSAGAPSAISPVSRPRRTYAGSRG